MHAPFIGFRCQVSGVRELRCQILTPEHLYETKLEQRSNANVEHRTPNIECRIRMTPGFIDFKKSEWQSLKWQLLKCGFTSLMPFFLN